MLSLKNRRNYILLSSFVFFFFFAQAAAISLLSIWLTQKIGLNGVEAGTVFSANFIAAMIAQPIFGYLSDRLGFSRIVPATIAGLVVLTGFFFSFIYAPLLQANVIVGAAIGGIFLGGTYVAGSYAVESYVDRISRREGFEYSRARLWGSLGFASAALFSGRLYNIEPGINFYLASIAGIVLLPLILATRSQEPTTGEEKVQPTLRPADSFSILKLRKFWGFLVLIVCVTNLYLV